jgi:DNA polymerase III alpha subunit
VYAKRAKELGMPAVALTDAGNLYGVFEFYKACKAEGVKAIVGVEFQISKKGRTNRDKDNETYQIVLIARDFEGYQNLIQLVTKSYLEGYYYGKPRVDFELLELHKTGLLALSGDHTGEIAQHVITGKDENFIRERLDFYENLYGKGNFYLEIQEHADRGTESKINQAFVDLSKKYAYPAVATNHVYYSKRDDAEAQDFLACIGSGRPLEDPDRSTLIEGDYSMRSSEEMSELFAYFPKALENTLEVMEKTNLVIPYGETLIPKFELDEADLVEYGKYANSIPKGTKRIDEEEWKLRRFCYTGLNRRFDFGISEETINEFIHKKDLPKPEKKLSDMSLGELIDLSKAYQTDAKKSIVATMDEKKREITDRIEYELTVVDLMGFNGYFNIVSDFINWAKDREIPVGP